MRMAFGSERAAAAISRRADLVRSGRGHAWIVESNPRSLISAPTKWMDYRLHCDRLFFATTTEVSCDIFPPDTG